MARGNAVVTHLVRFWRWRAARCTAGRPPPAPRGSSTRRGRRPAGAGSRSGRSAPSRRPRTSWPASSAPTRPATSSPPNRMTLAEFVEPWLDGLTNQGRRPSTLYGYRQVFKNYVLPRLGGMALQDLRSPTSTPSTPTCCARGRRTAAGWR